MTEAGSHESVGPLLREWRGRRRLTQLELALDAGVSARHLSFVETGRSKPGREMLLRSPSSSRSRSGSKTSSCSPPATPRRFPSGRSRIRSSRRSGRRSIESSPRTSRTPRSYSIAPGTSLPSTPRWRELAARVEIDPALLEPPINLLRTGLHPRGFAPLIINLAHWRGHFLKRLAQQIAVSGDDDLRSLMDEVAAYPVPEDENGGTTEAGSAARSSDRCGCALPAAASGRSSACSRASTPRSR